MTSYISINSSSLFSKKFGKNINAHDTVFDKHSLRETIASQEKSSTVVTVTSGSPEGITHFCSGNFWNDAATVEVSSKTCPTRTFGVFICYDNIGPVNTTEFLIKQSSITNRTLFINNLNIELQNLNFADNFDLAVENKGCGFPTENSCVDNNLDGLQMTGTWCLFFVPGTADAMILFIEKLANGLSSSSTGPNLSSSSSAGPRLSSSSSSDGYYSSTASISSSSFPIIVSSSSGAENENKEGSQNQGINTALFTILGVVILMGFCFFGFVTYRKCAQRKGSANLLDSNLRAQNNDEINSHENGFFSWVRKKCKAFTFKVTCCLNKENLVVEHNELDEVRDRRDDINYVAGSLLPQQQQSVSVNIENDYDDQITPQNQSLHDTSSSLISSRSRRSSSAEDIFSVNNQ